MYEHYIYELQLISCVMRVSWILKFIQLTVTTHIVHWKGKVCLCNCVSISKTALALLGSQGQEYPQTSPSGWWGRRWWLWGISHIANVTSPLPAHCNSNKEAQDGENCGDWAVFLSSVVAALGDGGNTLAEQRGGNRPSSTRYRKSVTTQSTSTSRAVP